MGKTNKYSDDSYVEITPTSPSIADVVVGAPCFIGRVPGIALDKPNGDRVPVMLTGVYRLPVNPHDGSAAAAVDVGDVITADFSDTIVLSKDSSEPQFGIALEAIAETAGVTNILVLLRGANTDPVTVPGAPTGLAQSARTQTTITMGWTAPTETGGSPITAYWLEHKLSTATDWTRTTLGVVTSATVSNLSVGTQYDFRVAAVNTQGRGQHSTVVQVTTVGATVPGAPTALASSSVTANSVTLGWTAPSSNGGAAITEYWLEYKLPSDLSWNRETISSPTTTGTIGSLTHYTQYQFRVGAVNSVGVGTYSSTVTVRTASTVPGAPTGLASTQVYSDEVQLSWSAPSDTGGAAITGYWLEYKLSTASSWTRETINTATASGTIGSLTDSTQYDFRVAAVNSNGEGSYSAEIQVTTIAESRPAAPTALTAGTITANSVVLTWTLPTDTGSTPLNSVQFEYKVSTDTDWTVLTIGATATSYTATSLTASTQYDFRVAAVNREGIGTYSSVVQATTT